MKEIPLRELMSMADPEAHEGIGELWNQKTIHYLVVFTSADADFEIIGAGPTLPYATLEAASQHTIPGKTAEFYVKCPGAIERRLTPKFAPSAPRATTPSPIPLPPPAAAPASAPVAAPSVTATAALNTAAGPTLKGRSSSPFVRPSIKLGPRAVPAAAVGKEQGAGSGEQAAPKMEDGKGKMEETPSAILKPEAPAVAPQLATNSLPPATAPDLAAREHAIAQREQELAALSDSLKIREASLRERETAIAAIEERLLKSSKKSG